MMPFTLEQIEKKNSYTPISNIYIVNFELFFWNISLSANHLFKNDNFIGT